MRDGEVIAELHEHVPPEVARRLLYEARMTPKQQRRKAHHELMLERREAYRAFQADPPNYQGQVLTDPRVLAERQKPAGRTKRYRRMQAAA
jgi:hypothetical protein